MIKKPYQAYAAALQTTAGTRQVVMLYDGILRYLQQAKEAMAESRIEDRFKHLTRAAEIIFGLQSCLDFEKGGKIAAILYQFYGTMDQRIFALHRSSDVDACEQIMQEIRQMRDVWVEIDTGNTDTEAAALASGDAALAEAPGAPPVLPPGMMLSA